tara:strand:+ start:719 stop:853 length:135 start_codon:yes stop_codon:yes gene_type:complete
MQDVAFSIVHDGDCFTLQEHRLRCLHGEEILIKSRNTPELEASE